MTNQVSKLLVFTSGGDAPGMNAAIRAVVRSAHYYKIEVFGALRGYQGIVDQDIIPLPPESVANIIQRGGTVLKTDRCKAWHDRKVRKECADYLKKLGIDGMVAIGGDGTFRGAVAFLADGGPPTIGIPGTIDNDINGSEYTIGFDTARNTALAAIDNIRDTASSHDRNFLVEVMGRKTGFLALDVGIAGGAEIISVPERPVTAAQMAEKIRAQRRKKLSSIFVIAEGDRPGQTVELAKELESLTQIQYRVCILGHIQRGGSPTLLDRKMATCMGALAVKSLMEGQHSQMTVYDRGDIQLKPFPTPENSRRSLSDERLFLVTEMLAM